MKNIKRLVLVVCISLTALIMYESTQRVVHMERIDSGHFCMYMDSYKSKDLGLLACFNGTADSVNEVDDGLSKRMMASMPIIRK